MVKNKEKLDTIDELQKNKKKRFQIKYDIDNFYRNKSIANDIVKERNENPKLSYNRFKHQDNRGYDIINMDNLQENPKNRVYTKDKETTWEKIVNNVEGIFI